MNINNTTYFYDMYMVKKEVKKLILEENKTHIRNNRK